MGDQNIIIRLEHITKCFGDLRANDDVSLEIRRNEIVSVLGENGAGKSTLMKVLFGLYKRDGGSIWIDGEELSLSYSPNVAMRLGVAMVHQHFKLVETYSVAQNIVLGVEKSVNRVVYDKKKVKKEMDALLEKTGIKIDMDAIVWDLPLGDRQRVEILKSLYRGCKILILDEPTTVLTPQETDALFDLLRDLRDKGMTIIIITHKLNEVLSLSDRVVVMRHGRMEASFDTAKTNADELATAMVGRSVHHAVVDIQPCEEAPSFRLEEIKTKHGLGCSLKGLNLNLYNGRVVGIAGVDGNGQTELVQVLAGLRQITEGAIYADGVKVTRNTNKNLRAAGIRIIPEDRHRQGLVLPLTIKDNVLLGYLKDKRFSKMGVFKMKKANEYVDKLIEEYDVRPKRRGAAVYLMSGGNQQKVVLARELSQPDVKLAIASQPSRGLDVGATQFTHSQLLKLRNEGKAILLISSDLDEVRALSDEIAVIYNGRIVTQKPANELDIQQIGLYMGGMNAEEVQA